MMNFKTRLEQGWYQPASQVPYYLRLLAMVFRCLALIRRCCYRWRLLPVYRSPVPVIVIGNISVGGTGKTPVVIWLIEYLRQAGYHPGIISRGYGGQTQQRPQRVNAESRVQVVGDEAVLLQRRCQCPMVVDANRKTAIQTLLQGSDIVDIVVADDGLQHYSMARDVEIVVIDGRRRFGNQMCLPAGPLRESISRLESVDIVINNGGALQANEYAMQLIMTQVQNLVDPTKCCEIQHFVGQDVHAVAGIGYPERFFQQLEAHGIKVHRHPFPDHYVYMLKTLKLSPNLAILMTEKDAVKCQRFAHDDCWAVRVDTRIDQRLGDDILALLP